VLVGFEEVVGVTATGHPTAAKAAGDGGLVRGVGLPTAVFALLTAGLLRWRTEIRGRQATDGSVALRRPPYRAYRNS
jgi:hypothetical protein